MGVNGYTYLPNGVIEQWGTTSINDDGFVSVTLPIPFPNNAFNLQVTPKYNGAITEQQSLAAHGYINSNSTISVGISDPYSGTTPTGTAVYWKIIGN